MYTCFVEAFNLYVFSVNKCPVNGYSYYVESKSIVNHILFECTFLDITAMHCIKALKVALRTYLIMENVCIKYLETFTAVENYIIINFSFCSLISFKFWPCHPSKRS